VLRRHLAAVAVAVALPLTLTGCFNGYNAQTTAQTEGGDTVSANAGDVAIRGLIWVRDIKDPALVSMSATFVLPRTGTQDELIAVTTDPNGEATITGGPVVVEPGGTANVGFNSQAAVTLSAAGMAESDFLNTTLTFRNAGSVSLQVLVVPATGTYAKVTPPVEFIPNRASPSASAAPAESASPSASPSPTGSTSPAAE